MTLIDEKVKKKSKDPCKSSRENILSKTLQLHWNPSGSHLILLSSKFFLYKILVVYHDWKQVNCGLFNCCLYAGYCFCSTCKRVATVAAFWFCFVDNNLGNFLIFFRTAILTFLDGCFFFLFLFSILNIYTLNIKNTITRYISNWYTQE